MLRACCPPGADPFVWLRTSSKRAPPTRTSSSRQYGMAYPAVGRLRSLTTHRTSKRTTTNRALRLGVRLRRIESALGALLGLDLGVHPALRTVGVEDRAHHEPEDESDEDRGGHRERGVRPEILQHGYRIRESSGKDGSRVIPR